MILVKDFNKIKDSAEFRNAIKEVDSQELIESVENSPEEWASMLCSHKIFPDYLYEVYKTEPKKSSLIDIMIEEEYLPSNSFLEDLKADVSYDSLLNKILKKFKSIPLEQRELVKLINEGFVESSATYVKENEKFQNSNIYWMLIKNNISNKELIDTIFESDYNLDICEYMVKDIKTIGLDAFNDYLIAKLIEVTDEAPLSELYSHFTDIMNREISILAIERLVINAPRRRYGYYRRNQDYTNKTQSLDYHVKLEACPVEWFHNIVLTSVPSSSKFRKDFVKENPMAREIAFEEVESLFESVLSGDDRVTSNTKRALCKRFLNNSTLDQFKKIESKVFCEILAPAELSDELRGEVGIEKALIIFEKADSKYRKRLRDHVIPKDRVPQKFNKNKKSYYNEVFDSIGNVESFRDYTTNYGYTLDKFVEDTFQSSKANKASSKYVSIEFLLKLNKEELLTLIESNLRMNWYENENKLPYSLNESETLTLFNKFNRISFLNDCVKEDRVSALNSMELSEGHFSTIISDYKNILEDEAFNRAFVKKIRENKDINFSDEILDFVLPFLDKEEIVNRMLQDDRWGVTKYMMLKDKEGNFIVDDDYILSLCNDKYILEMTSFIEAMINRSEELATKVVKAYLGGNKALSELTGKSVSIRRSEKDRFKKYADLLKTGKANIIKDFLEKNASLEEYRDTFVDLDLTLESLPEGTEVPVERIGVRAIETHAENNPHLIFNVKILDKSTGNRWYGSVEEFDLFSNIKVNSLDITDMFEQETLINSIMDNYHISKENIIAETEHLEVGECFSLKDSFLYDLLNLDLVVQKAISEEETSRIRSNMSSNIEFSDWILSKGLPMSEEIVRYLVKDHLADLSYLKWIENQVGQIKGYTISEKEIRSFYFDDEESREELKDFLISRGFTIMKSDDYNYAKLKEKIKAQGVHFDTINISSYSMDKKRDMIEFLEQEVDERLQNLDLKSFNLATLDKINNYAIMKTMVSLDNDDIIKILNIPKNIQNNNKIINGIANFLSINSGNILYKIYLLKETFEIIEAKDTLNLGDFLDYSNPKEIKEAEGFSIINEEALLFFEKEREMIQREGMFLKRKNRKQILRFLRSVQDTTMLRDSLDMISSIVNARDSRLDELNTMNQEELDYIELKESIDTLNNRLKEVVAMDDVTHMHDRLVPLMSFIREDPLQPVGQHKYQPLEEEMESHMGYPVYFPKKRGDIQYLGDTYGWCVTGSCHYTRGVMEKGNILLGICEKGTEPVKENVIALAHLQLQKDGSLSLEQLRWSKLKKNGSRNVSAVSSFNYSKIIERIEDYKVQLEHEKRKRRSN